MNELLLTHAEDHPDVPFRTLRPAALRFVEAVIGVESSFGLVARPGTLG